MTIQYIGAACATLYLTPADLKAHGIPSHSELTLEDALRLTRDTFQREGTVLSGPIEIEAYPDACGVLIFVHIRPAAQSWVSFPDLEALLAGLPALPDPCRDGALYWWEGRYWLRVSNQRAALRLSEFGRPVMLNRLAEARLTEGGSLILPQDAPAVLLRHFPPKQEV